MSAVYKRTCVPLSRPESLFLEAPIKNLRVIATRVGDVIQARERERQRARERERESVALRASEREMEGQLCVCRLRSGCGCAQMLRLMRVGSRQRRRRASPASGANLLAIMCGREAALGLASVADPGFQAGPLAPQNSLFMCLAVARSSCPNIAIFRHY